MSETTNREHLSAQITGRVQGVGFRHFTCMTARRLDVSGWVKNESDGSVQVEAEGPRDDLEELLDAVRDGPGAAQVQDVSADWQEATGEHDGTFSVRH